MKLFLIDARFVFNTTLVMDRVENTIQVHLVSKDRMRKANLKKLETVKVIAEYLINMDVLIISEADILGEMLITEEKKKKKKGGITEDKYKLSAWKHNIKELQEAKNERVDYSHYRTLVQLFLTSLVAHFEEDIYDDELVMDKKFTVCVFPSLFDVVEEEILENFERLSIEN